MARASFLIVLAFSIPFRAICDLIIAQPVPDPGNSTTTVVEAFPRNNKIIRNDAVLCLPVPLSEDDEKRLQTLQLARRNESRGIDATGSGLGALGLAKRHSFTRAVKQGNAPFLTVDTWFHIVVTVDQARQFSEQTRKDMVARQIYALNSAYRASNFLFNLISTTYTVRDDWATDENSDRMKQALRRGKYSTLNIWFQTNLTATNNPKAPVRLLGYCTTPTNVTYEYNGNLFDYPASAYAIDGCNVYTGTVPGSPSVVYGYNRGLTAAHEVGHWMGLLHTFEGYTCDPNATGDFVDDTPQESVSTVGCPKKKDSCPDLEGLDPITNFMDYSDDSCYSTFSDQQKQRMQDMYILLRQGH